MSSSPGHRVYGTPKGVDKATACLMHSLDPNKDDAAFQADFERILQGVGHGIVDFTGFASRAATIAAREFRARCLFHGATFIQGVNFGQATFTYDVSFVGVTFTQDAVLGWSRPV